MKKDVCDLYSILSDVLDCDYRRLIDAFDGVDGDTLSEAISNAKGCGNFTLDAIMSEVVKIGIHACQNDFYKKANALVESSDEETAEKLNDFDAGILVDSIQFEDGIVYSEIFGGYNATEMKFYLEFFEDEFKQLQELIGTIDGLPVVETN